MLERGQRHLHTDFRQSMDIEHLARVYGLVQGLGAQIVLGDGVGGSSNLYLAASLRSPSETFERRDHRPDDGPDRRMWPSEITRQALNPYYQRAEQALRVQRPSWNQVAKSGGLWAASLAAAGHTCDRVPQAIDLSRCIQAKWCHTGCIFGAKNSVITNYLSAAEALGVQVRPNSQAELVRQSAARPYRYVVTASEMDNEGADATRQPSGHDVRRGVQGADPRRRRDGQLAAADALDGRSCRASRSAWASTSASTATTSRRSSTTSARSATCSASPATARSTRATTSRR